MHDALFPATPQEYTAALLDVVRGGIGAGEPVLVAVPEPSLGRLRHALGADADRVRLTDMSSAGRNPGRIIGGVLTAFVREHAPRHVRVVGEPIWAGRTAEEYPACAEHEALIGVAPADAPLHVVCPYDVSALTPDAAARRRVRPAHRGGRRRARGRPGAGRRPLQRPARRAPPRPRWATACSPCTRRRTSSGRTSIEKVYLT